MTHQSRLGRHSERKYFVMKANKERRTSLELVKEVKNHPCLYNNELSDHSLKEPTEEAWEKVGRKLNLSGSECRLRWKEILKKFNGDLRSSPSETPYYLNEELQFIAPFIKQENEYLDSLPATIAEVERQLEQSLEALSRLEEETNIGNTKKAVETLIKFEPESDDESSTDSPASYRMEPSTSQSSKGIVANTEPPFDSQVKGEHDKNKETSVTSVDCKMKQNVKAKSNVKLVSQEKANEMFLLSLLHDVDQMSESQVQQFKQRTIQLLNDIKNKKNNT